MYPNKKGYAETMVDEILTNKKCKMRKEIQLDKSVISKLQKLADADKRSLKSFMEKKLIEISERVLAVRQKGLKNNSH